MQDVNRILRKYPGRLPVLIYPDDHLQPIIDKNKFIVPKDLTILNLIHVIRSRLSLKNKETLLFFIKFKGRTLIPEQSNLICNYYDLMKDSDGYLRIYYSLENTFG